MKIAQNLYYVQLGQKFNARSLAYANAVATELACYGVEVDRALVKRISYLTIEQANEICLQILGDYTVGRLNPPLFKNWEKRTYFSFDEVVLQICGYILQISGNDLENPDYMDNLLSTVNYKKEKFLKLATEDQAFEKFQELISARVSQDKENQKLLFQLSSLFFDSVKERIHSDEARIAVLISAANQQGLYTSLEKLNCKPADVLRYSAAIENFEQVKLPADVKYSTLNWQQRNALLSYLNKFEFDDLCESMGQNRQAWERFFKHSHLFSQKTFVNRYPNLGLGARISSGFKLDQIPTNYKKLINELLEDKTIEILPTGNTVYRTFASRIGRAIDYYDFKEIKKLLDKNSGYLLRNLTHISNGVSKENASEFVSFVREKIKFAQASVLFSILGINVDAKYRVIDVKGNTVVTEANYPQFIKDIQGDIRREIQKRWGKKGQVTVDNSLKNQIVPFLSKNSDLGRGTKYKFEGKKYLYFFVHWVQPININTDLDTSYLAFDYKGGHDVVYYADQVRGYITHGGDITSAPAPNGGTEYGRIDLSKIPQDKAYIAPVINVFSGAALSDNKEAYAGFMFSDSPTFELNQEHIRYNLSQPANSNIPFVLDVKNKEIVVVDFNNRLRGGCTAHSEIENVKKLISATNDKAVITMGILADILSGDSKETSLSIVPQVTGKNEIAPESLATLFN